MNIVLYVAVGDNPSPVFTVFTLQKMEQDDESQRVIRNVYSLSLTHNAISECEHTPHAPTLPLSPPPHTYCILEQ